MKEHCTEISPWLDFKIIIRYAEKYYKVASILLFFMYFSGIKFYKYEHKNIILKILVNGISVNIKIFTFIKVCLKVIKTSV